MRERITLVGRLILSFIVGLSLPASAASGLFLKTPPAANAFLLKFSGDTTDSRATAYALQGLVNQTSAEVFIDERGNDRAQINYSGKPYTVLNTTLVGGSTSLRGARTLFNKYHPSVQKLFLYDPAKDWTFYLAFMAGAQQNGIPVTLAVRDALRAQVPGWAGTEVDYSNIGTTRIEGYDWALANLMPNCTKQSVFFARSFDLDVMDYVAASKSFVFNLLSSNAAESAKISEIFATPGYGVGTSLGGYAGDSVNRLANPYGIGYNVSDFYSNGSFWSSFPNKTYTQSEGQAVTAQNGKVYVVILLSDGDNLQFDQGALYSNWKDPNRGTVPVATALSPVLQEINTPLLDWYYANKTVNDELIAGPCGFQFIYLDDYKSALLPQWCEINAKWTADAGFHTASVWLGTYPSPNYDVYTALSGVDNIRHNRNLFSITTNPRFSNGVAIFNERIRDCQSEQELYEDLAGIATNPSAPLFATGKLITARFGTTIFTSIKTVVDRLNADFPGKYVFQLPSDQAKTAREYQPKRTWNTGSGTWNTSTANWLNSASAAATFANSVNTVVFEDASGVTVNPVITLNSTVTPLHVTMKSTARSYTISGTGGIGGGTALILDSTNTRTLTLACDNTYTGGTTINGGTLKVGNGGASGNLGSGNVINNATLEFNTSSNNTYANSFSGTGTLANTGTGTLTLTGENTYTGVTTISSSVLILGNSLALQNSPLDTLNSIAGGLKTTVTALTLGGLTGNKNFADLFTTTAGGYSGLASLTLNPGSGVTHSYSADIGNGNGSLKLIKTGLGTQVLSGTNTYSGSTTIGQGTLAFSAANTSSPGGLTFGATAASTATGSLDLSNGSATFGGVVVRTNSVENNSITIGTGRTLATNGNVVIGTDAGVGMVTHLTVAGNGSWTITNPATSGSFLIGAATGATNTNPASLELSGLQTFNANLSGTSSLFRLGDSNGAVSTPVGSLKLAANSTITAATFGVSDSSGAGTMRTLSLGTGANTINANNIRIGEAAGNRGSGTIDFRDAMNGTLVIRSQTGATSTANLTLVNTNNSGASAHTGRLLLAGHNVDVSLNAIVMASRSNGTGTATAEITFDNGTFSANTVTMTGRTGSTLSGTATGTITLGGGTASLGAVTMAVNTNSNATSGVANATLNINNGNVTATSINMANAGSTGSVKTANGNINLNGGSLTLTTGNITRTRGNGTENAIITLNGGILDMGGRNIGTSTAAISLVAQSGTIRNLASVNGSGGLTKTTAGTLVLEGTNTYSGATNISEGTLALGAGNALPNTSPVSIGEATLNAATAGIEDAGTLAVAGAATLNLAAGTRIEFDASNGISWPGTLNLTGTFISGSSLKFGNIGGLTSTQLGKISATGFTGFALNASGYLTANAIIVSPWIANTFANGQVPVDQQGPNDDPDNDGISNLIEYAIAGQDPTVPNATVGTFNGTTLSFDKRPGTSGLTYAIQQSTDLGISDPWAAVTGTPPNYVNDGTTISYKLNPGTPPQNFLRLQVLSSD